MVEVTLPVYDNCGIDVIFDSSGFIHLYQKTDTLVFCGNRAGILCLAKQLLYFYYNAIPNGAHIHYDEQSIIWNTWRGLSFVLEKNGDACNQEILLDEDELHLAIDLGARLSVDGCLSYTYRSCNEYILRVNSLSCRFLALELLRFCSTIKPAPMLWSNETLGAMWMGINMQFQMIE